MSRPDPLSVTGEKAFSFNYDNDGNTTSENTNQFIYNQNQRLTQVSDTGNVLGEYIYNGSGQRVKKFTKNGAQCTVYHYDQNGLLMGESASSGNIRVEYVYLNGQPLAKIEGDDIYYYHNDHLGTPIVMTDSSGTTVWSGEYLPFGEAYTETGSITNNIRFPGQYYDEEIGLNYNYFRDYKPEIGRYVQSDPIGLEGGVNLYSYVNNNPVNRIDLLGLYSWGDITSAWDHYCDGSQVPWSTTFSSINWGNVRSKCSAEIKSMVGSTCTDKYIPVNNLIAARAGGADYFIIGRHTIILSGQIKLSCDCSWSFAGRIESYRGYDPYNFNPSNRGPIGEASAWIGRNRCPNTGKTFNINIAGSESLSFSGTVNGVPTCGCKK